MRLSKAILVGLLALAGCSDPVAPCTTGDCTGTTGSLTGRWKGTYPGGEWGMNLLQAQGSIGGVIECLPKPANMPVFQLKGSLLDDRLALAVSVAAEPRCAGNVGATVTDNQLLTGTLTVNSFCDCLKSEPCPARASN